MISLNWKEKGVQLLVALMIFISAVACKKDDGLDSSYSNFEKVLLIPEQEEGYGGYYYEVYTPFVFFTNGRFIRSPYIAVNQINADKYIAGQGEAVGAWVVTGDKVEVTFDSGRKRTYDWLDNLGYAPNDGQKISGTFETVSGGGTLAVGGDGGVLNYSTMSFTADGLFTTERLTSSTSENSAAYQTSKTSGKYKINKNYSITLTTNEGKSSTVFFCWYNAQKTRVFRLAGRTFSPE